MALVRWRPFRELEQWLSDEDWMVPTLNFGGEAVDIYEEGNDIVVEMPSPGIAAEKINIEVENGFLRVSGEVEDKKEVQKDHYYRKEIRRGSFERRVALPVDVKADAANAEYAKGMLKITLPKNEKALPKKINVKVKE